VLSKSVAEEMWCRRTGVVYKHGELCAAVVSTGSWWEEGKDTSCSTSSALPVLSISVIHRLSSWLSFEVGQPPVSDV